MKKTAWTPKEDAVIRQLFPELGHKWSQYMPSLPGRSDNAIKNRYHVISRFGIDCLSRSDSSSVASSTLKRPVFEVSTDETDSQDIKSIKSSKSAKSAKSEASYAELNQKRLKSLHSARDLLDRKIRELESTGSVLMSCPPSPSDMSTTFNEKELAAELAAEIANELGTELDSFDFMWTENDRFLAKESESLRSAEIEELGSMAFDFSCYDLSFE